MSWSVRPTAVQDLRTDNIIVEKNESFHRANPDM